jgi:hypothetical protein
MNVLPVFLVAIILVIIILACVVNHVPIAWKMNAQMGCIALTCFAAVLIFNLVKYVMRP